MWLGYARHVVSRKNENVSDKILLLVAAQYSATAPVESPRTARLVGRGVIEPGAESPRVVVLQARPVRVAGQDRSGPAMRDRWILPSSNPGRTFPTHVTEAYRPSPAKKQGTRIDVYV